MENMDKLTMKLLQKGCTHSKKQFDFCQATDPVRAEMSMRLKNNACTPVMKEVNNVE